MKKYSFLLVVVVNALCCIGGFYDFTIATFIGLALSGMLLAAMPLVWKISVRCDSKIPKQPYSAIMSFIATFGVAICLLTQYIRPDDALRLVALSLLMYMIGAIHISPVVDKYGALRQGIHEHDSRRI